MFFLFDLFKRKQAQIGVKRGTIFLISVVNTIVVFIFLTTSTTIANPDFPETSDPSNPVEAPHVTPNFAQQCRGLDRLDTDTQQRISEILHWAETADCGAITPLQLDHFWGWRQLYRDNQCVSCNLSNINLAGFDLIGAALRGSDLSGANLRETDLVQANLSYAQMMGADLFGADLESGLLRYVDLEGANLSTVNLSYANLTGANLAYANLTNANLTGTNLAHANLSYANLLNANLDEAIHQNTNVCGVTLPNGSNLDIANDGYCK